MTPNGQRITGSSFLQHPLEVPRARRSFLIAALLRVFASPHASASMVLGLWAISDNPFTPVVGGLACLTLVAYAERSHISDAWAHIPRRRQDRARDEPEWLVSTALSVEVALLLIGCSVVVVAGRPDIASLASGALLGLLAVVLVTMSWDVQAPRHLRVIAASTPIHIAFASATLTVAGVGVILLGGHGFAAPEVAAGAVITIVCAAVALMFRLIPRHVRCLPSGMLQP